MTGGMGFGGQVGAELTDFIMVLNTASAVKTFMHHGSITLGGNISGKIRDFF
jgi:lipid-binding SYLF domain-containing protein